jgi:hypothetical protein
MPWPDRPWLQVPLLCVFAASESSLAPTFCTKKKKQKTK